MNETNGTIVAIHSMQVLVRTGADIRETINDAIAAAKKYDCLVSFVFNSYQLTVSKDSNADSIAREINM